MRLPKLDLVHCSQLRVLTIRTPWSIPKESTLPLQLQRLGLFNTGVTLSSAASLAELQLQRLQELQHLSLQVPFTAGSLQELTQLQALQHVALEYTTADDAEETAGVWRQLPHLRELTVLFDEAATPDKRQMLVILRGIEACVSLTKLELEVRAARMEQQGEDDEDPDVVEERVSACRSLAGLTNLQDLGFSWWSQLTAGDALWLTALTGLTSTVRRSRQRCW
jgi:hypothetical protein